LKGLIVLPKYLNKFWIPKTINGVRSFDNILSPNAPFFYSMADVFGFKLCFEDAINVTSDIDIVFIFGVPYHNRPKMIPGLLELPKEIKLVIWPGDIQCYGNKECLENKIKVFERADLILSPVNELFEALYPQFLSKYVFMPKFFSPHSRYLNLEFNKNPKMKCLLSGSLNKQIYPFRSILRAHSDVVVYEPPNYFGDSYARLLNSYFCCVATSSIFNYAVAKHYEIPAVGSLLIADETNDLSKAGFIPNTHYIPINKSNMVTKIRECLRNPKSYNDIRLSGMKFVRENHSINNRMLLLKEVFNELLNRGKVNV
jgi:hypothetical protein